VQPVVVLCLLDVARGLEYLHSCNIVHGDLKPQNVLLKTAVDAERGFVCKLGDFGLSRIVGEADTHVETASHGTVTHAAPELLTDGRLAKPCDIYSFGILAWELATGGRLFPDMHYMQASTLACYRGSLRSCAFCVRTAALGPPGRCLSTFCLSLVQIIVHVTQKGYRPPIPPSFPPALASLVQRCWDAEPHAR
jgi:serine/threonine protein kinase